MELEEGVSVQIGRKNWTHKVPDRLLTPELKEIISRANEKQINKVLESGEFDNDISSNFGEED